MYSIRRPGGVGQPQRLAVVVAVFIAQQPVTELHAVALGGHLPDAGIGDLVEPEAVVGLVGEFAQRADPDFEELLPGTRLFVTDLGEFVRGARQSVVPQGIVPGLPFRDVAVSPAAQVAHDARSSRSVCPGSSRIRRRGGTPRPRRGGWRCAGREPPTPRVPEALVVAFGCSSRMVISSFRKPARRARIAPASLRGRRPKPVRRPALKPP